ncbi:MAG: hypothetical protein EOP83_26335 [Verrucomicrobiaceae bacterium]|nr:MAG: hypothetical protein EOP83_26335 [Verrucomicrobiaceae bacterium]
MNRSTANIPDVQGSQDFDAKIVPGHRVASGGNNDPRFPGGTIRMQIPHFKDLGIDLTPFYPGTINVGIAPRVYQVVSAPYTFRDVRWHPEEPAEDFSFFDVELLADDNESVIAAGLIYHPHPDTKPEHFQKPDVLELLLPYVEGIAYGRTLRLRTRKSQILIA